MTEDFIRSQQVDVIPYEEPDPVNYDSDFVETDDVEEDDDGKEGEEGGGGEESGRADLGGGWGRIIFSPVRRGRHVTMDVCRSTKQDGSEGEFQRVVVTRSKNPTLHHQARRSFWGDLWPF